MENGRDSMLRKLEATRALAIAKSVCAENEVDVLVARLSGMSAREIAATLSVTESVVDHRYRSALSKLRKKLGQGRHHGRIRRASHQRVGPFRGECPTGRSESSLSAARAPRATPPRCSLRPARGSARRLACAHLRYGRRRALPLHQCSLDVEGASCACGERVIRRHFSPRACPQNTVLECCLHSRELDGIMRLHHDFRQQKNWARLPPVPSKSNSRRRKQRGVGPHRRAKPRSRNLSGCLACCRGPTRR